MTETENKFKHFALIFGIFNFFVFVVSFTIFYTTENFSSACGCELPLWVIIVSLSSLGLFVGLTTYYILSTKINKVKSKSEKNLIKILDIFEENNKKILKFIIENKGSVTQSSLSRALNFDKVKTSRMISELESKGIIRKEKKGMTNKISLSSDLSEIFLK